MKNRSAIELTLVLVAFVLGTSGCILRSDRWWPQVRVERTVELEHPLEPGTTLAVATASGSIDIAGQEVNATHVVATIQARAATEEEAQELAEQVVIRFEQSGSQLEIKAERPPQRGRRSISISYQIVTPRQTHVQCNSASGALKLTGLAGDIEAHTASGSVEAARIEGTARLRSASGSVRCEDIQGGDIYLGTASGGIRLSDATQIGTCDLHTASGSVDARDIEADSVKMRSASGATRLNHSRAQTADLYSASGKVTARDITCDRLKAESVSGGVSVVFAPLTPGNIVAEMSSGSGRIDVTVPPSFAGRIELSVGSGSIHTDLPLRVEGRLDKKHVTGSIGDGSGSLSAQTTSGSIHIR